MAEKDTLYSIPYINREEEASRSTSLLKATSQSKSSVYNSGCQYCVNSFFILKVVSPNLIVNIPDVALNITSILSPNVTTTLKHYITRYRNQLQQRFTRTTYQFVLEIAYC